MKRVPNSPKIRKALRTAVKEVQVAFKQLNAYAARRMSKGDYSNAEIYASKGREIQSFKAEVEALGKKWRDVLRISAERQPEKGATTPLWGFYRPILKALTELGGRATRAELEKTVEQIMRSDMKPGDMSMSGSRIRWQVMIQRARKHLVSEGWLDSKNSPYWQITSLGRRTAESESTTLLTKN